MRQRILDQIDHVPIRQGVIDVRALAAADHQARIAQDPQTLRNGREFLLDRVHDLRHTPLPLGQQLQKPPARRPAARTLYQPAYFQTPSDIIRTLQGCSSLVTKAVTAAAPEPTGGFLRWPAVSTCGGRSPQKATAALSPQEAPLSFSSRR